MPPDEWQAPGADPWEQGAHAGAAAGAAAAAAAASQKINMVPGQHQVSLQLQTQAAAAEKKIKDLELQQLQLQAALANSRAGVFQPHPPAQPPSSSAVPPIWDSASNTYVAPNAAPPDGYAPWRQYNDKVKEEQKDTAGDGKGNGDDGDRGTGGDDWRQNDKSGLYGGVHANRHW